LTEDFNCHKNPSSFVVTDSEKDLKKQTVASVLGRFFALVTLGGLLLSLGLIGVIKWARAEPSRLSIELAVASLALGIALDGWAIRYFWQRRKEIFEQLK
jgi:hypothetical protein